MGVLGVGTQTSRIHGVAKWVEKMNILKEKNLTSCPHNKC
jgi:hypothetical protein